MKRRNFLAASVLAPPFLSFAAEADDDDDLAWLERRTRELIQGCRIKANDGTTLFTPDGRGFYPALWTRDFSYMVENAPGMFDTKEVETAIAYLLRGVRSDGAPPDRVQADGRSILVAGPVDAPIGEPNLDDAAFLVFLVDDHLKSREPDDAARLFTAWRPVLERTMAWVPRSRRGLVWNDPEKPHSPYGFTDNIAKTGELFIESVLDWRASRRFAELLRRHGRGDDARRWDAAAVAVEEAVDSLRDDATGLFFAASRDCRQLDVWGNAFALAIGFPMGNAGPTIQRWYVDHVGEIVWNGQVRHLPGQETWNRLFTPVPPNQYQNGAYWATATGWLMEAVAAVDLSLSRRLLRDLVAFFRKEGVFECAYPDGYRRLDTYVVSATNPLGAARRLGF